LNKLAEKEINNPLSWDNIKKQLDQK
jgi:hypothetical protein